MGIDWAQARRNDRQNVTIIPTKEEAAEIQAMREQQALRREREQEDKDREAYVAFAESRFAKATESNDARAARVWIEASSNARLGTWTYDRIISADPEVVRFQKLRSRLCIAGATIGVKE